MNGLLTGTKYMAPVFYTLVANCSNLWLIARTLHTDNH